jgi:osmotically inducible protein OsmC
MAIRTATAEWKGDLPSGTGSFRGVSGTLEGEYSVQSRFEEGPGTSPEELIAAAHASCYSMFLSGVISEGGNAPESVRTEAKVQIVKDGDSFTITRIDLATVGRVPGIDDDAFQQAAQVAKEACPVSKALGAVAQVNLDARLESS